MWWVRPTPDAVLRDSDNLDEPDDSSTDRHHIHPDASNDDIQYIGCGDDPGIAHHHGRTSDHVDHHHSGTCDDNNCGTSDNRCRSRRLLFITRKYHDRHRGPGEVGP